MNKPVTTSMSKKHVYRQKLLARLQEIYEESTVYVPRLKKSRVVIGQKNWKARK